MICVVAFGLLEEEEGPESTTYSTHVRRTEEAIHFLALVMAEATADLSTGSSSPSRANDNAEEEEEEEEEPAEWKGIRMPLSSLEPTSLSARSQPSRISAKVSPARALAATLANAMVREVEAREGRGERI